MFLYSFIVLDEISMFSWAGIYSFRITHLLICTYMLYYMQDLKPLETKTKFDMKTVSGTVISSKPISLSKATSILSTFVSTENGASQAIGAYLRRTLASFKELKQLHKELKTDRSEHKRKRRRSEIAEDGETNIGENSTAVVEASQEEPKRKKHRR